LSVLQILFVLLTGSVFAIWAYLMFRTLADQRRRATQRTGQVFPGLHDALIEWGHWLRTPDRAADRRQLLIATVLLLSLSGLAAVIAPFGGH